MIYAVNNTIQKRGSSAGLPIVVHLPKGHVAPPSLMSVYVNGVRVDGPGGNVDFLLEERKAESLIKHSTPEVRYTDASFFSFDSATGEILGYDMAGGSDVVIPEQIGGVPVVSLGFRAFYNTFITSLIVPDSVKIIKEKAISQCPFLTYVKAVGATTLGTEAFGSCTSLETARVDSAVSVGALCFSNCQKLEKAFLPHTTVLGTGAFYDCYALSQVHLPLLSVLDANTFYNCLSLEYVRLPSVVEIKRFSAFRGCSSLRMVYLPRVTDMWVTPFNGCSSLTGVYFKSPEVALGSFAQPPYVLYPDAPSAVNYVIGGDPAGWGSSFGGNPVVHLDTEPVWPQGEVLPEVDEEAYWEKVGEETMTSVVSVRVGPEAATSDNARVAVYYAYAVEDPEV